MLVDDSLLKLAGLQVGIADKQGDLVVFIQIGPQFLGEAVDVGGNADPLGLAQELWTNLDENNKISLFVRYTDLETREVEQRIINKHC